MKTILKALIVLALFTFYEINAQNPTKIKLLQEQNIKGKSNEYCMRKTNTYSSIKNMNEFFRNIDGKYNLKDFELLPIAKLSDNDWTKLKHVVDSLLGDIVLNTPITWNTSDELSVFMRSNMQGKIKDVTFVFPTGIIFPIDKIEKLEKFIKEELELHFEINHTNQNANFMSMNYGVEFEPMRQRRINKPISAKQNCKTAPSHSAKNAQKKNKKKQQE